MYNTYGPRQDLNRFIPIIISGCIKNKKFPCSKGNQLRDFLHVDDVVEAILKSLTNKNAKGQIINIGSGKPRIIKNIIEYIKKILKGGYPLFGKIKLRKDEILTVYPDINKAKNKINWRPKISFKEGLKINQLTHLNNIASEKPLVSVIINCFNGEKYLREALDSIITQTYNNWEIIFWDNQSTDKSAEIFKSFKDSRLKYYCASSHADILYEARNYALKKTNGDFIAFLDVDDWWLPNKLEKQIPLFDDPDVGLVYGNVWRFF